MGLPDGATPTSIAGYPMPHSPELEALIYAAGLPPAERAVAVAEYAARPLTDERIKGDCEIADAHLSIADHHLNTGYPAAAATHAGSALALFEALVSDGWEQGAHAVADLMSRCEQHGIALAATEHAKARLVEWGKL